MAVNITTNNNTVKVVATPANKVKVVNNVTNTSVTVSQPTPTQVVRVVTAGPQGPTGPQGAAGEIPNTGSFATTGSNNFIGNQTISGSLSQGFSNIASGPYSHAEGEIVVAAGSSSHAEGYATYAANYAHSEGSFTSASNDSAHSEGFRTIASGNSSHAEGYYATASGGYSHAEGRSTLASGIGSHAEGIGTVAAGNYQHAEGQYNISSSAQGAWILGNGSSTSARSNLIYAQGNSVQITGSLTVSGSNTFTNIGPAVFSGSINVTQGISGSFSGSGANLNSIPASAITGLSTTQIATGSVTASVSTGTGSFQITSGSTSFLFISSSGNVGIGTATPTTTFQVLGTSTTQNIAAQTSATYDIGSLDTRFRDGWFSRNLNCGTIWSNNLAIATTNLTLYNAAVSVIGTLFGSGNLLLSTGTQTDAGYKLDVSGSTRISGTTTIAPTANTPSITSSTYLVTGSGTTPLLDLNGTVNTAGNVVPYMFDVTNTASGGGSFLVQFRRNGSYVLAIGLNDGLIYGTNYISATGAWNVSARENAINGVRFGSINSSTHTSGNRNHFNLTETFAPTSGTGTYSSIQSNPTINQTGGANGITRGLYINPTITSASDFRAIETTTGRNIFTDTYAASGSANSGSLLDLAQTWNTSGTPIAIKLNVTDTASNSLSDLMSLQVGGSVRFRVLKSGYFAHNTGGEIAGSVIIGSNVVTPSARLQLRGSGATSATTTFLVQNSTPTNLLSILDNGQVAFTSPTMSLAASQSAFSISPIISASAVVGGQYYGVNITPTFFQTTGSQTKTAFRVAATYTGSSAAATNGTNIIADFGSTSAGSQLTVTDVTSGSIYMVNDVSGLPIIEATSDWGVKIYDFPRVVLEKTGSQVNINGTLQVSGSFILPLSQSATPQTGSAYWSGSLLFIYNGTRYMSASLF